MTSSTPKLQLSDDEWRRRLNPQEFDVLRRAGTERPFVGEYTDTKTEGVYQCRACGTELFRSTEKFESHCGWPSFFDPANSDAVILRPDNSLGQKRVEVLCANCHSHLGHVFEGEGYPTPTDQRYCINSISLRLVPSCFSRHVNHRDDTPGTFAYVKVSRPAPAPGRGLAHPGGVHFPERGMRAAVGQPRLDGPEPLGHRLHLLGHFGSALQHPVEILRAHVDLVRRRPQIGDFPTGVGQHTPEVVLGQRTRHVEPVDVADAEFEHVEAGARL